MESNINKILKQAITAHQEGRLEEAEKLYQKILDTEPTNLDANKNLSILLHKLGRLDEAEASCKKTIELKPDFIECYYDLGNILYQLGKLDEAEKNYRKVTELKPDHIEAYYNLGIVLQQVGKIHESMASFKKTIELKPDYAEAHSNLGAILKDLNKFEEAELSCRKAIEFNPNFADAHNNLGIVLFKLLKNNEAVVSFKKAIEFKPDFVEAYNNLATIYYKLVNINEAEACLKKAIELNPNYATAYYSLSIIKTFKKEEKYLIQAHKLSQDQSLTDKDRCYIFFTLAKAYEDLNQLDSSFKYYVEGNKLHKKISNYDINHDIKRFDQLKKAHESIKKNCLKDTNQENDIRPIFIVGMPRSGTTLIEQIISSHSKVMGGGEISHFHNFGDEIARGISKLDNNKLLNLREKYLQKIRALSNGSPIITDKMPANFMYISLIYSVFPMAKIVHVKRNPAATCWGNYKLLFSKTIEGYNNSLDDLVAYYKLYQDLMQFWNKKYIDKIYNLNYETLTMNQEDETKKLIQFLDLEWEDECLAPQNNKRIAHTASDMQVRQKVYSGSSEKWKKFEPFLNGIFDNFKKR